MNTITEMERLKSERDELERALDAAIVGLKACEEVLPIFIAERDRARCTAIAFADCASAAYALLWQALEMRTSHADEAELGRTIARFLRENAADAGPDRVPLPTSWEESA